VLAASCSGPNIDFQCLTIDFGSQLRRRLADCGLEPYAGKAAQAAPLPPKEKGLAAAAVKRVTSWRMPALAEHADVHVHNLLAAGEGPAGNGRGAAGEGAAGESGHDGVELRPAPGPTPKAAAAALRAATRHAAAADSAKAEAAASAGGSGGSGGIGAVAAADDEWAEMTDESGDIFFFCARTGESAWERPEAQHP